MNEHELRDRYAEFLSLRYPHLADEIAAARRRADTFDTLMIELGQVFQRISREDTSGGD